MDLIDISEVLAYKGIRFRDYYDFIQNEQKLPFFRYALVQKCFAFTVVFVPFSVKQWATLAENIRFRCVVYHYLSLQLILTLKLNNPTTIHSF